MGRDGNARSNANDNLRPANTSLDEVGMNPALRVGMKSEH